MKRFKDLRLKYQLTVVIFFISLVSLWLASTAFVLYDRYAYKKNMTHELTILSRVVASQLVDPVLKNDHDAVIKNIELLAIKKTIQFACVTTIDGKVLAYFARNGIGDNGVACISNKDFVFLETNGHIDLIQPVYSPDSRRIANIHIREDFSGLNKRFGIFSVVIFIILIMCSGVAAILSARIQHFFSAPLILLKDTAEKIAKENDYSIRVRQDRDDEIGKLYNAFNKMVETIDNKNAELREAKNDLENQVEQRTAELKTINNELEAFTYSVSHDLRTPLRAIDGFSAALAEDAGHEMNELAHDYLRRIRAASRVMADLIDALLSLSRLSRIEMNRQSLDLAPVAHDIADHLALHYPGRKFQFICPPTLLAYGDKTLMGIVLDNLMANAWKYSANVPAPRIELGSIDRNGEEVYFIRDNGAGFNMKHADKLFVPFQRLHKADEFEGIGIGLATVARIIHRHGGEIWAEGLTGDGAVFYFTLGRRPAVTESPGTVERL